jgi:hypothetical protein
MKSLHKKTLGYIAIAALVMLGSGTVQAETFEGTVQGYTCLTLATVCPVDRYDPHMAAVKNFVIANQDKDYRFVSNVSRRDLGRHILGKARVTGELITENKSIEAEIFEINRNGKWRTVWSLEMEEERFEELTY